jgi:hypothetical protein
MTDEDMIMLIVAALLPIGAVLGFVWWMSWQ